MTRASDKQVIKEIIEEMDRLEQTEAVLRPWLEKYSVYGVAENFIDTWRIHLDPSEPITEVPEELKELTIRSVSAQGVTFDCDPKVLFELEFLEHLDLRGSNIRQIPAEIGKLEYLESLELAEMELDEALPDELFGLKNLKVLNLWKTKLKTTPKLLGQLENLTRLALTVTEEAVFPSAILELKALKHLDLYGSSFEALPLELTGLTELNHLCIDRTPIYNELVPEAIRQMPSLRTLVQNDKDGNYDYQQLR